MKNVTHLVNNGRADTFLRIDEVEKKYNAKYVGQLALRTAGGGWSSDDAGEVFYQETPPVEGYSHYFALIRRGSAVYITSGQSAVEGIIDGVAAVNEEIIYSRYRHDMRYSKDQSVWIDGGRDYVRTGGGHFVSLKIIDGEWYQVTPKEDPEYFPPEGDE